MPSPEGGWGRVGERSAIQYCLSACGYPCRCPTYSERQNAMQQVRIGKTVMLRCRRKFLALRDLGIGIRFEEIWNSVGREAKIDACISVELQRPVHPFGCALDAGIQLRRKLLRRPIQNADALLILGIALKLLRGNGPCTLRHAAEFELPYRQHPQPLVAEHADIELTSLDILLGDGGGADPLVNEGDAL